MKQCWIVVGAYMLLGFPVLLTLWTINVGKDSELLFDSLHVSFLACEPLLEEKLH